MSKMASWGYHGYIGKSFQEKKNFISIYVSCFLYGLSKFIYCYVQQPNDEDPLNHEAAVVLRDNPKMFEANVKRAMAGGYVGQNYFPRCAWPICCAVCQMRSGAALSHLAPCISTSAPIFAGLVWLSVRAMCFWKAKFKSPVVWCACLPVVVMCLKPVN